MKSVWPWVLAAALSIVFGCAEPRMESALPIDKRLIVFGHDDAASTELARRLGDELRNEMSRVQAACDVETNLALSVDGLLKRLADKDEEVVVLVGFPSDATSAGKAEIEQAIHALDRKGVRVYTLLVDFPNTRRRAFFGLPATSTDYAALAKLAAKQIVESVVFQRDIKIVQILDPNTGAARP